MGDVLNTDPILSIPHLIPTPTAFSTEAYPCLKGPGVTWSLPTCFSIHTHWNPATRSCQVGFLLMALTWLIPRAQNNYFPLLFCGSQVTCHLVRKIFPTQKSHLPHHSVAFSWFSLSMAFITNGIHHFFFQFAYLDIICLLAGISAPRGQGSVSAILSPQPGLVTTTWLVPSKRQMIEWMCQLELWRN